MREGDVERADAEDEQELRTVLSEEVIGIGAELRGIKIAIWAIFALGAIALLLSLP